MSKTQTIALTGRRPITITVADWTLVARSFGDDANDPNPATYQQTLDRDQCDSWELRVLQNAKNHVLVYGSYTRSVLGSDHTGLTHAGQLLQPAEENKVSDERLIRAIGEVGEALGVPAQTVADCIADLPAEEI